MDSAHDRGAAEARGQHLGMGSWGFGMSIHPDGRQITHLSGSLENEVLVLENFLPSQLRAGETDLRYTGDLNTSRSGADQPGRSGVVSASSCRALTSTARSNASPVRRWIFTTSR